MIRRIQTFEAKPGLQLFVRFDDGKAVMYDVLDDVRSIPSYAPLETVPGLFAQVQLDQSRTCVFWNEDIDLPSDVIYDFGRKVSDSATSIKS